jgi:hypothetical protein
VNAEERIATRPAANLQDAPLAPFRIGNDANQLLTRREIREEFGFSERTWKRIEEEYKTELVPVVLGKAGGRTKRYFRRDVQLFLARRQLEERAIRENALMAAQKGVTANG